MKARSVQTLLRPGRPEDIEEISEISRQMWFGDEVEGGHEFSVLTARNDTLHLYREATYLQVAVADGAVMGTLMARVDGDEPHSDMAAIEKDFERSEKQLLESEHGQHIVHYLQSDRHDTEQMAERTRQDSQAEILLFLLSPAARGLHLGSRLFDNFLTHLQKRGGQSYYLYTDSDCTYGFYDHRGMRRVAEHMEAPTVDGGSYDKFIYRGEVLDTLRAKSGDDHS